jgi:hypothetical protein
MFNPETNLKVYEHDIWWSDKWDPRDYGQDYDFSKPFFEQYKELLSRVPLASVGNTNCINSPYGNHNADCKNCYLVYASYLNEDVMYSQGAAELRNCVDTYSLMRSENCYGDILSDTLYQSYFCFDSDNLINTFFLSKCVNCQDCVGCVNLRNKRYCILNEQYTKEEYLKEKEQLDFGSYKTFLELNQKYKDFFLTYPQKYASVIKSVNVSGDYIMNSKNVRDSFDVYGDIEDSRFVAHGLGAKDSYDVYGFGAGAFLLYEGVDIGIKGSNNYFAVLNHACLDTKYSYMCYNAKNLFGCVGIRKGEYCILNKKYGKEEYEKLVPKIIQHMIDMPYVDEEGRVYKYGEFFPSEISPFAYNETIAQEYFPQSKNDILTKGYKHKEQTERNYKITINSCDLPDHIKDINDDILNETIGCPNNGSELTQCTQAYKIIKDELTFLRRYTLPLPRFCPNCRHYQRLAQRNPMKLWHRKCMKEGCTNEFETSYAPDRPEIIYCEKCYQQEVL